MLKLGAKIKLIDNGNHSYTSVSNVSGVAIGNLSQALNNQRVSLNPFLLGISSFDSFPALVSAEDIHYAIGGVDANINPTDISFTLNYDGGTINDITIVFDKQRKEYATSITIGGTTYSNNSPIFTTTLPTQSTGTRTVTVSGWSVQHRPIVITCITSGVELEIDDRTLVSLSVGCKDRDSTDTPSFGVISRDAELTMKDPYNKLADYQRLGLLDKHAPVEIYLKETVSNKVQTIGKYFVKEWERKEPTSIDRKVSLVDGLTQMQNIEMGTIQISHLYDDCIDGLNNVYSWRAKEVYNRIVSENPTSSTATPLYFTSYDNLPSRIKNILDSTFLSISLFVGGNMWDVCNAFCTLCRLCMYKGTNGEITLSEN